MKISWGFLYDFSFKKVKHIQEIESEHEEMESVYLGFQLSYYHGE